MALQLPNLKQIYAARDCLKDVLIHDQQLVAAIEKIEYAGQIERFGELHYIFKFREPGGPWLVGVSGGYKDKDQLEPGDYVGSMGDAFNEATMKGSAIALLDDMKSFMESEDAKNIQQAFEDDDIAGMISHIKDVAAKAGLDISEEEIKNRLAEAIGRMEGADEEAQDELRRAAETIARYGDERFFPTRCSQSLLLDTPTVNLKKILAEMKKREFPVEYGNEQENGFSCLVGDCMLRFELSRPAATPMETLRRAAIANYTDVTTEEVLPHVKAELKLTVEYHGAELWDRAGMFPMVWDAALDAFGRHALAVYTGEVVLKTDLYGGFLKEGKSIHAVPIQCFLWTKLVPRRDQTMTLELRGLNAFGLADLVFPDPFPLEAAGGVIESAYNIGMDFLDRHWYPDYEERIMGDDGRQYFAYPEEGKDDGPGTLTLRLTDEILMDDDEIIRENLRDAGVKASQFSRMNRAGFFIRWAEANGFLADQTKNELAAYDGPNGLRGYLYYDWDGAPDASLFVPALRPFVAEYYNVNRMVEKTYFTDLEKYAWEKLEGTKKEDDALECPEESHALLRWGDKTAEEIGAIIEKRYKAWKKKR